MLNSQFKNQMFSQRQLFLRHLAPTSEAPLLLEIERGDGVWLYDTSGKKYLDAIAGIGVSCLGHNHPAIKAALHEQTERYLHTMVYGEYVLSPQVAYAKLLTSCLPAGLDSVYLVNSGAEATEGAMKLAKRSTGRSEIIACHKAYHGSTQGAASLMSDPYFTRAYRPLLPGIKHITYNRFEDLACITEKTAAIVIEPVQAESGVTKPVAGYLEALRRRCNETGCLLVFDEAQTAFGRTGHLFAFQGLGVQPDILLLAKGMAGGMPLGAFIASRERMSLLSRDPVLGHITTFGGHPMSCAAAVATLQTILDENLIQQVADKEKQLKNGLQHEAILEVRTAGLWAAVELESFGVLQVVIQKCIKAGVITDWFLFNDRSMRLAPPLTITEEELDFVLKTVVESF
jgi:acetylornithine/N-succinyldiaminopimelate aminotransferase